MEPSSGLAGWLAGALYATQQLDLLGPLHPPTVVLAVPTLCIDRCIGDASIPAPRVNDSSLHSLQWLTALGDRDDQLY